MPTQVILRLYPSPIVRVVSTQKPAAASEIWPFVPCSSQTHDTWEFVPNQTWKHVSDLKMKHSHSEKQPLFNLTPYPQTNRILSKPNAIINISIVVIIISVKLTKEVKRSRFVLHI